MASLLDRLLNTAIAEDEALNALGGGKPTQTLSGTVGRAAIADKGWAVNVVEPFLDGIFGRGHCRRQAAKEAGGQV